MHRTYPTAIAIIAASAFAAHAETALKVMTFNIRWAEAEDGANNWSHRRTILTDAVRAYAPDVVGTQECLEFQAEFIAQTLPEYRWIGVGCAADGTDEMPAIFYRKAILSPIETGVFWLSETPEVPGSKSWETRCIRMATWARFRHIPTDTTFYYFNTHLDHKSEEARANGAKLLVKRAAKLAGDFPVIVTGDFNAPAGTSEPWRIFTDKGYKDAWLEAGKRIGPEGTFGRFGAPREGDTNRIDWILLRGHFQAADCETVLYNEDGWYPSDHYPVVANLILTP